MKIPEGRYRLRAGAAGSGDLGTLEGLEVFVPKLDVDEKADAALFIESRTRCAIPADTLATLGQRVRERPESFYTDTPPASSRLPFSYAALPRWVRSAALRMMGRRASKTQDRWAFFPGWPLDLSADVWEDAAALCRGESPKRLDACLVLSHDVDTLEGLRWLPRLVEAEEAAGYRSVEYVVPFRFEIDHGILRDAAGAGCEIGVHGCTHDNKLPYCEEGEIRERLARAQDFRERYGARGFRAPSLLRTERLFRVLASLGYYDSSVPTSGGRFPTPNNGCASARAFRVAGLWELPITLPRDGSLLALGHSPREILDMWKTLAKAIITRGGIVHLLTHGEAHFSGNDRMLDVYREFLGWCAGEAKLPPLTPRELVERLGSP